MSVHIYNIQQSYRVLYRKECNTDDYNIVKKDVGMEV